MAVETGNRRPETGELKQETLEPGAGTRRSPSRPRGFRRPLRRDSGFRSPVSGIAGAPVSGLEIFAGIPYRAIRGRLGDRVYKTYGDKVIVTRVPCFDGYVPTAAQRERREKLRAATAYAQAVYANPAAKGIYVAAAKQLGRQPFRLAVSDFLHGRPRVMLDFTSKPLQGESAAPADACVTGKNRDISRGAAEKIPGSFSSPRPPRLRAKNFIGQHAGEQMWMGRAKGQRDEKFPRLCYLKLQAHSARSPDICAHLYNLWLN